MALVLSAAEVQAGAEIYDAKGQYLGDLMDIHSTKAMSGMAAEVKIFVPKLARYVMIDESSGRLESPFATLWYPSRNCRGSAFVDSSLFHAVGRLGGSFITGLDAAPTKMTVWSYAVTGKLGGVVCKPTLEPTVLVLVPAVKLDSLPFQLPVALPLLFEAN